MWKWCPDAVYSRTGLYKPSIMMMPSFGCFFPTSTGGCRPVHVTGCVECNSYSQHQGQILLTFSPPHFRPLSEIPVYSMQDPDKKSPVIAI